MLNLKRVSSPFRPPRQGHWQSPARGPPARFGCANARPATRIGTPSRLASRKRAGGPRAGLCQWPCPPRPDSLERMGASWHQAGNDPATVSPANAEVRIGDGQAMISANLRFCGEPNRAGRTGTLACQLSSGMWPISSLMLWRNLSTPPPPAQPLFRHSRELLRARSRKRLEFKV